jgi:hypothetical protein
MAMICPPGFKSAFTIRRDPTAPLKFDRGVAERRKHLVPRLKQLVDELVEVSGPERSVR